MLIKISKLFYFCLLMYYGWFQVVFFQIPNMLLILGIGMMGFIFLHAIMYRVNLLRTLTIEFSLWIMFAVTSLLFGLLIATNQNVLMNQLMTFIQFLIMMYGIIYISIQDRKIDFFINTFIIFSIVCAFTTLFWGVDYGQGRLSMGMSNNPNSLGITMAIGVCCVLYKHSFKKLSHSLLSLGLVSLLTYVTLLTGSRKSLIAICIVVIYWFFFVVYKDIKKLKWSTKFKSIISLAFLFGVGIYLIYPYFKTSVIYTRLMGLFEIGSQTRLDMYQIAIDLFKSSPLVGIGFNNYRVVSGFGTYSHSTYAEVLACTGLIGTFLYFFPYIKLFFRYLNSSLSKKADHSVIKQIRIMFGLFGMLLFLGTGVIHIYSITSCIAFGMLISLIHIYRKFQKVY